MRKEGIPKKVLEAMHDGNRSALSAMGKKGAERKAMRKELAETERSEDFAERAKLGIVNDEGDVVLPDDLPQ